MATAIQRRRGNTAQHASFTGLAGEITIDTQKNTVVVHDGVTAGGYPLARADEVEALGGADITAVIAGSGLTGGSTSGNATISLNYENLAGNLVPSANNTYSLGSINKVWKDVYVGPGSLYVNGQKVLEDNNGTIVVSADSGQNLSLVTSGGGDLELSAGATGDIQLKSNIVLSAGKTITASGGIELASNIDANSQYINNLSNPVQAQDAATKHYVDNDSTVVRTTGTQTIAGAKTFSDSVIVSGNLTVSGTTTTVNSETISLADNIVDLNSNFTSGAPTENAGLRIKRGDSSDVQIRWNEADDKWQFTNDGSAYLDMLTSTQVKSLFSATDSGGDGSFSYSDGVFTYTGPSATEVRAHLTGGGGLTFTTGTFAVGAGTGITVNADDVAVNAAYVKGLFSATDSGGDGSFSYSDGVFTYTGPSATEVRAHLTGGDGLTFSSGTFAVGAGTGITVNADDVAVNATYIKNLFSATDSGGDGSFSYSDGVFTYTGPSQAEANARIDARISGGTGITYTSGVIATTITQYTDALARAALSVTDAGGDGSLSYNNSTGVFTYTGPSATEVRAHLSAGTGVTYSSGQISIGQAVGTTSDVTFNNMIVSGNLTVSGTTTSINTETINLADNIIVLNSNEAGTPSQNAGIEIERGTSTNVQLRWNETDDKWQFTNDGSTYADILTASQVKGLFSATDSGGDGSFSYSDGVFTYTGPSASDVRAHLSAGTGLSYSSGQFSITNTSVSAGVYGSASAVPQVTVNAQGQITAASNINISISSGQVSDFATAARGNISLTDAGGDGSMSYNSSTGVITYTGPSQSEANARIDARLSGGTGITYTSGVIATTITQYTDALARAAISVTDSGGDGSLAYNSSTGVITYTGPSAADVRAHFTAGTGVAISSGQISIGQAVGTTDNVTFNNVTASANFIGNLTGTVTGNVTGNAGTATTLATARTIGGVSFNGSASIDLPGVNTAGNQNTTGNAGTATKWATPRTITLTGDVTGVSGNFDGSGNLSFATTIAANSVALGTDTTGNYVASVANGAYITGGSAGSEGATLTLAVDATTTATASKVAARDASGDLYAVIFQGTASSARYADLAERYEADAILEPGTVVCFGGEKEITACDHENDHAVAGVVSTDPAYMMNSAAGNNDTHPYIALTGRVPVKVVGPVAKGDLLVASEVKGHAMANNNAKAGTIIGKAIGSSDNGESVVEALINLM
jgi:hypothetical protein